MGSSLLTRLDARDRALFARWTIDQDAAGRRAWVTLTHLGGALSTIAAAGVPLLASGIWHTAALRAAIGLSVSHALVQLIKRNVIRERPSIAVSGHALVGIPDAFSFPSGHATAAMAVALAVRGQLSRRRPRSPRTRPRRRHVARRPCACTIPATSWRGRRSPS